MSIQSVLLSPDFLLLISGIVAAIVSIPGGVLQSLLLAILAHFKRNIPAEQYAQLQALAADVVKGVHQEASALGWASDAKKQRAVAILQALAKAHGITRFGEAVASNVIEKVYADVKPSLPQLVQNTIAATAVTLGAPPNGGAFVATNDGPMPLAPQVAPAVATPPTPVAGLTLPDGSVVTTLNTTPSSATVSFASPAAPVAIGGPQNEAKQPS